MFYKRTAALLRLVRCVEYQNMTFYILICSLHHCLIQIKVIVFVPRGNILFHFLGQTVEACCGNVHLLDPERDAFWKSESVIPLPP